MPDDTSPEDDDDLHPEPLDMGIEDLPDALPHGDNSHPPSEADAPAP